MSVISGTTPDCKLAMDFESFGDLNVTQINDISKAFLEKVEDLTGKEQIIYSNTNDAINIFGEELAEQYPVWIAEYGVTEPRENGKWSTWEGFQYTNMGRIQGINGYVDRDKFTSNIFLDNNNEINNNNNNTSKPNEQIYIVRRGDTLSELAIRFNTTVQTIVNINGIKNPNLIYPGEQIKIKRQEDIENTTSSTIYTVKRGDTLSQLAKRFNVSVEEIAQLNEIRNINLIFVGERLKINMINN